MLRRFVQNTAISAVAYALAGVLGLFAVGLIARSYGLAVLGLIVLVRSFLPTGVLALVDFGVSETATQVVARGRVGDWSLAREKVSILVLVAGLAGTISAIALWIAAPSLAMVFKVAQDQAGAFVSILEMTALMLPIAFLGLVTEGAIKGFQQYGWLRATEVASNILYVAAVYVAVWQQMAFEWIAYAYLAVTVGKYFILAAVLCYTARHTPLRLGSWGARSRRDILHRCWLMFNGRIGGTLQQTVIPLAIGALFSPVEVGTYDLIMRLPRFMKTTMAPIYSAILPISTHIDETTDTRRMQILGRNGFVLPAAVVIPIMVVIALFSEQILKVWVGPEHAGQWPWLAIALLPGAVTVMLGAGQMALMVRTDFLRLINRLLYLQVLTQYLATLLFLVWFREMAFILGWTISYIVFGPVFAYYILREMGLPPSLFWKQLARHAAVAAMLAAIAAASKLIAIPDGLLGLVAAGGFTCICAWILSGAFILSNGDRAMFGRFARAMTQR